MMTIFFPMPLVLISLVTSLLTLSEFNKALKYLNCDFHQTSNPEKARRYQIPIQDLSLEFRFGAFLPSLDWWLGSNLERAKHH